MKADRVPRAEDHEENYTKENSRDLQKVPLKYSTSTGQDRYTRKLSKAGGRFRGNSTWNAHKARNRGCFH